MHGGANWGKGQESVEVLSKCAGDTPLVQFLHSPQRHSPQKTIELVDPGFPSVGSRGRCLDGPDAEFFMDRYRCLIRVRVYQRPDEPIWPVFRNSVKVEILPTVHAAAIEKTKASRRNEEYSLLSRD